MQDLWSKNIGKSIDNSPVTIMREQAKLLGQKTNNLVEAEVGIGSSTNGKFVYHFYIVASTLNDYHFRLFTVEHDIEMYPLTIYVDEVLGEELGAGPSKTAAAVLQKQVNEILTGAGYAKPSGQYILAISSESDFVDNLRKILNSKRSQQVINVLLSQMNVDYTRVAA